MGFPFLPISNNRLAAPSLAMALLMASTGSLPVLAANRASAEATTSESGASGWQRIANQDADADEKKKKKKKINRISNKIQAKTTNKVKI